MNCIHHDKICLNINSFYIFFSSLFRAVLKAHQSMCLLSSPLFPLTFFSYISSLKLSASFPHPSFLSLPYLSLSPSLTLLSSHFFFLYHFLTALRLLPSPFFPLTFFSYTSSLPLSASFPHPSFLSLFFLISLPYLSLSPSLTLLSSHFFFLISLPYLSLSPTFHPSISLFQLKKVIADGLAQAGSAAAEVTEICLSGGKR